ncbi:hypothetical protein VP14_150 [Vibrio phage VPMCC14]|nr:hypothetical protein VP14_150 [Vibrio phage VPMCC14]
MRQLLIKWLGGMTRLEHLEEIEKLKDASEEFCKEYLHLNGNNHSWQGHLQGVSTEGNLVVLRSETSLSNCTCDKLVVAPWARKVIFQNISYKVETNKTYKL